MNLVWNSIDHSWTLSSHECDQKACVRHLSAFCCPFQNTLERECPSILFGGRCPGRWIRNTCLPRYGVLSLEDSIGYMQQIRLLLKEKYSLVHVPAEQKVRQWYDLVTQLIGEGYIKE